MKEIVKLRKELHEMAECSMQEEQTRNKLMEFIRSHTTLKVVHKKNKKVKKSVDFENE